MIGTTDISHGELDHLTDDQWKQYGKHLDKQLKPMRNKQSESQLQGECVRWFRYQYPQYRLLLFAIPNGGKRNISTAKRLKAEGVVSGVADLFLAVQYKGWHTGAGGLFIEMKYGKGKQSESQKEFQAAVLKADYKYEICSSFDEFQKTINNYLKNHS